MKILTVLTYYRPHTSGLTIYVERLSRTLVELGHEVTVLTSHYDQDLPREEVLNGVRIVRAPVLFRVSKGVIMPTFPFLAWKHLMQNDLVHLHLPQFDAAGVALIARLLSKPAIISYHSDLELPPSFFNRIVNQVVLTMNDLAAVFANRIVAYTEDFASHSPYLTKYRQKVQVTLPPVDLPPATEEQVAAFARQHNPQNKHPVIGMATRFAAEKGVEILLDALPSVLEAFPDALVHFAGQYKDVMNEEAYLNRLMPEIRRCQENEQWEFLGVLSPEQMSEFYPNLDVLLVPSLNSTETFGLVQIEAMMNGTPTVASNLPGVRQPVRMTGMGEVVPIGDADALAEAMIRIFSDPEAYSGDPEAIARQFSPRTNASAYVDLYRQLLKESLD